VLIKCVVGLLRPDAGEIRIEGEDVTKMDERELVRVRRKFGMLFQGAALFDSLNVGDNVAFALRRLKIFPERQIREVVEEKLSMVGLRDIQRLMPAELSGGMKKRVGLARAIAAEPDILLYDEPTTGLDPIMADVINDLIVSLRESLGVTSISITHDMASAYKIADYIAMLYKGRIVEVGTPAEIRGTSNPVVRQFVEGRAQGPITAESEEFVRFVRRRDGAAASGEDR
jgi:phospholipid/cholesterol/gamma-HCH transport system ATP-binding protein